MVISSVYLGEAAYIFWMATFPSTISMTIWSAVEETFTASASEGQSDDFPVPPFFLNEQWS